MDLTQMMLVICGLVILGMPVPGSNRTVLETSDAQKDSEFGITIIEMTLQVESPCRVQDQAHQGRSYGEMEYATAFWRQTRLALRNIKRHG